MLPVLLCLAALPGPKCVGGDEPLNNDTFLPSTEAAQEAIDRGDLALARLREGRGEPGPQRSAAFDAWREALVVGVSGDVVRAPAGTFGSEGVRFVEGVQAAVLRRYAALAPEEQAAWGERFDPLATAELTQAGMHPGALARVERQWPRTRAAAIAAVRLTDASLERGDLVAAGTWLRRSRLHADLGEVLVPRQRLLTEWTREPVEAWRTANSLELRRTLRLESDSNLPRPIRPAQLGRTLIPDLCWLDDGSVAVQTPRGLVVMDDPTSRGDANNTVYRTSLAEVLDVSRLQPFVTPSAGGWALRPATDGRDLVLIVDRGMPGRIARDISVPASSNFLVRMTTGEDADVVWHLSDHGLFHGDETPVPLEEALGLEGRFEFQPGPIVSEGVIYVQVRVLDDPTREGAASGGGIYLVAVDEDTGRGLWSRYLTDAADLRRDLGGRNGGLSGPPTTGMPLVLEDGVLVVGTNVGLVCAFDAIDGRWLWGFRNGRRGARELGWPGSRSPVRDLVDASVHLAPFDSTYAYEVPLGPALEERFFLGAPLALDLYQDLVGGSGDGRTLLGLDGRHPALRRHRPGEDVRSSLHLAPGEAFAGEALCGEKRVLLSSNRAVYLFDREREDYLLSAVMLPDMDAGVGGTVRARGDRVAVIGQDTIWILQAR